MIRIQGAYCLIDNTITTATTPTTPTYTTGDGSRCIRTSVTIWYNVLHGHSPEFCMAIGHWLRSIAGVIVHGAPVHAS